MSGPAAPGELSHLDGQGRARMVNVTAKAVTRRRAVARCRVRTDADPTRLLAEEPGALSAAELAGIQAAKQTATLIPLCHPLPLDAVVVKTELTPNGVAIEAVTEVTAQTGVEMEALTACAAAGLSVVAALLPFDQGAAVEHLTVWSKSGGRSGSWERR